MVLSMDRWRGKVAVVTGASVGIGAVIAEQLVKEGLKVVGLARRVEKIAELSKKLSDKEGKLYAVQADMTAEEDIINAFKWTTAKVGPVSILINNAGIVQQTGLIDGNTEMWKKVLDTNVLGLCIATREAIKIMRENKIDDGHIIHISSIAGHYVPNFPEFNVYPASKHAVKALTETLRQELNSLGSKIRITSVSPGYVETEIMQTNNYVLDPSMVEAIINKGGLKPEDVADAVLYALSTPPHVQVHDLIIRSVGGF